MISRYSLLLFVLVTLAFEATAQGTTDEQLAAYYFREAEYDKASLYYERLYDKRPSQQYYSQWLSCLLALEQFKDAEKLAEKQAKKNPTVITYQVDIGNVLKKADEPDKARKQFDKTLKNFDSPNTNQYLELGNAFLEIGEPDYALEVYYMGRKRIPSYPFNFQIANVLGQKGDIKGMISEYLDVLETNPSYLQSVQNTLNRVVGFEDENKYSSVLREELTKRSQRNASSDIYAEMLIWMYMRQNRFELALIEVKAMDKRNREDGSRVLNLANVALSNYKYDIAIDAFEYVRDKGRDSYFFLDATTGLLESYKQKITHSVYDNAAIEKLLGEYERTLDELGRKAYTAAIIRDYAHVKAYYESVFNPSATAEAATILEEALVLRGLEPRIMADLKIELADVYVISGNVWEASLLYGQVEKAFKYDEIGQFAKFKNARVFYYSGEFDWASAQLNVLKGSTSKLIANDAMELSVFITENTGLDSTTTALQRFSKIELMVIQHKFDSALLALDNIEKEFPGHPIIDNVYYLRGHVLKETRKYEAAIKEYEYIVQNHGFDLLADNALMEIGQIQHEYMKDTEAAMNAYERVLRDYPGSLFTVEARKRFRSLRGDAVN